MLFFGLVSVGYWYFTEMQCRRDLRIYGLVQFLAMLLIPVMLFVYGSRLSERAWIFAVLCVYAGAKIVDIYDPEIYNRTGFSAIP